MSVTLTAVTVPVPADAHVGNPPGPPDINTCPKTPLSPFSCMYAFDPNNNQKKFQQNYITKNFGKLKVRALKEFNEKVEKFNGGLLPDGMKKLVDEYSKPGDPGKPFTTEQNEENRKQKAEETFKASLKKHKMTEADLDRIIAERTAVINKKSTKKPKKTK